jgi:hypothetical protein
MKTTPPPTMCVLTPAEGKALFERQAQKELNVSGAEFIRRWKAGRYAKLACEPKVLRVAMLLPLAR